MKNRLLTRFISLITSLALVLSLYYCFPDSIIKANSTDLTEAESVADTSDTISDNPFDKQDDMEVPYDRTRWVQPKDWNTPKIDPRDYDGGIMLYFDKIGLDPEYAKGKVQRVYFSITGATEPVSYIKFHVFYDTRLTVKENSAGKFITPGKGLNGFTTGSAKIEDGQLAFYAYAEDTLLDHSCLFTIDFIVPENAEQGEVYPIGLAYTDDGIVADTFINSHKDEAGKALIEACKQAARADITRNVEVGSYQGFKLNIGYEPMNRVYVATLSGFVKNIVGVFTVS